MNRNLHCPLPWVIPRSYEMCMYKKKPTSDARILTLETWMKVVKPFFDHIKPSWVVIICCASCRGSCSDNLMTSHNSGDPHGKFFSWLPRLFRIIWIYDPWLSYICLCKQWASLERIYVPNHFSVNHHCLNQWHVHLKLQTPSLINCKLGQKYPVITEAREIGDYMKFMGQISRFPGHKHLPIRQNTFIYNTINQSNKLVIYLPLSIFVIYTCKFLI